MLNYNEPIVMGILNCTPDSFFDGSRKQTDEEILLRARQIVEEGGAIIDIGAFSTRPGAAEVSEEEELRRMEHALSIVRREYPDFPISIDTFRPSVARMAVEQYHADIINDVSEGKYPGIFEEVARLGVPYILMSVQPDMATMIECFEREVAELQRLGVNDIILDPGYGFGKEVIEGNYAVLRQQQELKRHFPTLPILAGVSRKRMVRHLFDCKANDREALDGTMLVNLVALQQGATILRVHDVKEAVNTIKVFKVISNY